MPGAFLLGARYFREQAPGIALDRANNAAMGVKVDVPVGVVHDCVVVFEESAIDPIVQHEKVFCRSIGLVRDGELELVRYG